MNLLGKACIPEKHVPNTLLLLLLLVANEVYERLYIRYSVSYAMEFILFQTFCSQLYRVTLVVRCCAFPPAFAHRTSSSPVPRVVSAYFYCQRRPHDQLCATVVKDAAKVDLVTFAEHWGNFGLRQFALAFIKSEDVFHDAVVDDFCKHARGHGEICLPSWYRLKTYLNALSDQHDVCGAAQQPESGLAQFLSRAQETLSNRYAAVGILEEWDDTMKLFNEVLSLRGFDWVKQFQQSGTKNSSSGRQFETAEQRALETAWHSAELKRFIWLDILLYDHALTVHRKQLVDNGIPSRIS